MRPLIFGVILSAVWSTVCSKICSAQPQTVVVRNAASASGLIAPGSLIELVPQPNRIIVNDPSRISVQVRPSGSAGPLDAPVLSPGFLTLWARLPDSLPLGPAQITLSVDGVPTAPADVTIVNTGFGLFTQ